MKNKNATGSIRSIPVASGRRLLLAVTLAAVALGIFARIDSLDRKVLWRDESFSLLRISGHSEHAMYALFDGKVHSSDDMAALTHVSRRFGLGATLASLHEEPQRGPLYYLLARVWIGFAGNATAAVRGLSVWLGIVGIGLGFLVGRRLTGSVAGGLVLTALTALSPIEIRFSQQIREYILVADLTLVSVLLLLRAIERPSRLRWFCYGFCALAGLYTNVTFVCVILAQGLVALFIAPGRDMKRKLVTGFMAAGAGAAILYAPWAYVASRSAAQHSSDIAWAAGSYSLRSTATKWAFNIGAVFFDSEYAHIRWGIVLLPLLVITAVAVARAFGRGRDVTARALALAVTLSTLVPLVALDTLHHGHFALVARYQMPTWIGVSMLVTLLVVPALSARSTLSRTGAICALGALLIAGATSVFVDRPFTQWWDNNDHLSESAVASVVRAGSQPALVVASIADDNAYDTFVLSRYLAPRTPMLLFRDRFETLPPAYAATYFFTPSRLLLARVTALEHVAPRNVSPAPEFAVPELNAARNVSTETVVYDNSLWELRRDGARRTPR